MTPRVSAGRIRAQRQLERDYEALKSSTLRSVASKLRSRSVTVPEADLEAYYNQAWHALYERLSDGESVENVGGFLVLVAFRRALDDLRRQEPQRADLADVERHAIDDATVDRLDDRRRLREFVEAMRDELDQRERTAASLCYLHGYTRPQAADAMGLSERRMKKVMDEVSRTVGRFTREIQAGTRCQGRESSNKAYAIGLLDPEGPRYTAVRAHLDDCSACRADVLRMRGLAIVAPPVLLPWGLALATGAIGGGGAAAAGAKASHAQHVAIGATAATTVIAGIVAAVLIVGGGDSTRRSVAQAPAARTPPPAVSSKTAREPARTTARAKTKKKAKPKPKAATPASPPQAPPAATIASVPAASSAPVTQAPAPPPPAAPAQTTASASSPPVDGYQEFGLEP